jgi:HEAT repeat protein
MAINNAEYACTPDRNIMMSSPVEISFQELLDAILDADTPLHPRFLYRLSDLEPSDLARLAQTWPQVPLWRRQAMLEDLEQLGEADLLLSFETVGRLALVDKDPQVRALAVRILWEFECQDLIPNYLKLVAEDDDEEVRAVAATALGSFVYRGELDELPTVMLREIEDRLLWVIGHDRAPEVRRRALEALSFSSRSEVPHLIETAFQTGEKEWMVTALFAMGRSVDKRWEGLVLNMLHDRTPALRAEATRASGELELSKATPRLIELAEDGDKEVRAAAIWSLSQIGGRGVRASLEHLWEQASAEDELNLLQDALDNLTFTEDVAPFTIFDLPEDAGDEAEALLMAEIETDDAYLAFTASDFDEAEDLESDLDALQYDFDVEDDLNIVDVNIVDAFYGLLDDDEDDGEDVDIEAAFFDQLEDDEEQTDFPDDEII